MGTLILQDGTVIKGDSFGALGGYEGEVVFNTIATGYQELITDPANAKQIIVMAYPEIGNYGINETDFESENPSLVGLVVKNYSKQESHYKSKESLASYLKKKNIIAIENVDTRSLIRKLTEFGSMPGFITSNDVDNEFIREKLQSIQVFKIREEILSEVTPKTRYYYNPQGTINVAMIDYGVRKSLIKELAARDCKLTIYPADTEAKEILDNDYDALFLSSGPGNPNEFTFQIAQVRQLMGKIPMFGISLGCELLALASGATVTRLRQGHRGGNYPVINLENNKVIMTSQNHGYVVDSSNMTKFMRPTYKNLNDDTIEGFEITSLGIYAIQFDIEASYGSKDALYIFDEWINIIKRDMKRINEVNNER